MSQTLQAGETAPLKFTPKGDQRVQVGVSWDVGTHRTSTGKWIFKKEFTEKFEFDLDLLCCIFDAEGNFLEQVTPDNAELMDSSEQIYHIGDNQAGRTAGDDEFISLNMATLPAQYHSIVFLVGCHKGKKFHEVENPVARVADGATDKTQFEVAIDKSPKAQSTLYIFAKITRDPAAENGWSVTNISDYNNIKDIESWDAVCKEYL